MAANGHLFLLWLMTFIVGYLSKPLADTNDQIIVVTVPYFGDNIPAVSSPTGPVIYLRSNPVRIVLRNRDSTDVDVRFVASAYRESNNDIANDSGSNVTVIIARGTSPEAPSIHYQTITVYQSSEISSTTERRVNYRPQTTTSSPRPQSTAISSVDYGKRYPEHHDAPISTDSGQNDPLPFDQRRELTSGQVPRRLPENPAPTPSSAIDRNRPTVFLSSKPCRISTTAIPNPVNPINNEPAIPRRRQPVNRDAVNSEPGFSTTNGPDNNDGGYSHEREVEDRVQLSGRRIPWAEEKGVSERIIVGTNQKRDPTISGIGNSEVNDGNSSRDTRQLSRLLGTWLAKPRRDFRTTTAEELEKKLREYIFLGKIIGPSSSYRTLSRDWRSTPTT